MKLHIRPMRPGDLEVVFALQCHAHTADYHEPRAALASRFEAGPGACLVAEWASRPVAYVLAHPWQGAPPPLHRPLAPVQRPDQLFLHDLAVVPEARGVGAAGALIDTLARRAQGLALAEIRLVALVDAVAFWQRKGWRAMTGVPLHRSYGSGARLKTRPVARP